VEAVQAAAGQLMQRFYLFSMVDKETAEDLGPAGGMGISPEVFNTLVENLDLSARTLNCLRRAGLNRVGEVLSMPRADLLKIRNFGQKSLEELYAKLEERGLLPDQQPQDEPGTADEVSDEASNETEEDENRTEVGEEENK
jgi:DNA-directed RNA polymerase subunit alpha